MTLPDYWLPRPPMQLDEDYAEQVLNSGPGWLEPTVAKWQFLCYLADKKGYLLHGSGSPNIEMFEPRQSNDIAEFGNRKAVYAARDGIWPMFFAILDRTKYKMTIVNAAIRLESSRGELSDPYYFFSMTDKALQQKPFREGVVYVLPRDGFEEQNPYHLGEYLVHQNHWANLNSVKPVAKLRVSPHDFPFLNQIRGQDDDVLAKRIAENPNGFPWVESISQ